MELLERERHLVDLAAWLSDAAEGSGCIALVGGEAGIGKTALFQEFAGRQGRIRVLWGACDALFTPRPLAPLHDIARQTQGALLAALESSANRDAIFAAALDELERQQQVLVVFEDMHWADEATLDLLKFLGRRIQRTHAMLAVTYRDEEVGPRHPLRSVIGDLPRASLHRMLLSPLSEVAVAQLAAQAGRSSKGLYNVTGGNPLFVTEVLAADDEAVPATVRDAVLARATRLSPAAREIAELVCVVPGKAETWLLEQAARADETGIEGCLSIGMVRDRDGALAFRHELVRRALVDSLGQSQLQSLHARVLAILAPRSAIPAARLAHHASGARDADQVLRFAPDAATQAASVGAHREAASHLEVALEYAARLTPEARADLQEKLSYECHLTSQHERAIQSQRSALEIWRNLGQQRNEGNALRWLSRLSWFAGDMAQCRQYGLAATATLESLGASPELAMAYCERADFHMECHEEEACAEWAQRAIALAQPWGNSEALGQALCTLGTARLIGGNTEGWADLDRSLEIAKAADLPDHVAASYANLAAMAVSHREYERASRYLRVGLDYCDERDMDWWWLFMLAYRARLRFEQGDWNGASEDVETVLRHPGATSISRIPALRILGHVRIRRGDPDANSPLEEAQSLGGPNPELQRIGTLAAIRAEAAWLAGDHAGVLREAQPAYQLVSQRRDPRMKGELAGWLWRVGALEQQPTNIAEACALEISGNWRAAANAWQMLGCPYEHANMLAWYGTDMEQREALTIFERLGATPSALALRKKMRARGVRGLPRGARKSTTHNPLGLTKREAAVLELLSEGLRNSAIAQRMFVSTRTVDHHVSAILTKLGAQSRADAIAIARRIAGGGA
jgi:DNA-binding CsgD family transcriptional regulator/tetratricopeptide (TPR) repeat protein